MLSLILVFSTIFPGISVALLLVIFGGLLVVGLVGIGTATRGGLSPVVPEREREERFTWRMPPIALLTRPVPSRGRRIGMTAMGGYILVAMLMLLVKAVELGVGH
jgi:hypothetical protein